MTFQSLEAKMNNFKLTDSLDKNKVFLVKRSEIEDRLDPQFYDPYYYSIFRNKDNWIRLNSVTDCLYHPPEYKRIFSNSGYQLIRSQNVRPIGIDLSESPVFLDKTIVDTSKSISPAINDILIVRSGVNAGDVAVVEKEYSNTIVGADTLLLRVDLKILPKFVQVYFYTDVGRKQLNRYITGATNKHINSYSLKHVYFPILDKTIQNKCIELFEKSIKESQSKQSQSKTLLKKIDTYLLNELGIELPKNDNSLKARIFTTKFSAVCGNRLDPFYVKNESNKMKSKSFEEIALGDMAVIEKGQTITSDEIIEGNFPVIAGGQTSPYNHNTYNYKGNCITISASGAYAGYVWYHETPIFASDCMVVYSNEEEKMSTLFLSEILKLKQSEIYDMQQGAGQPHVYAKDIYSIQIPLPPLSKQIEIADHIKEIRSQAKQLEIESEQIILDAKKEIEKMILGE